MLDSDGLGEACADFLMTRLVIIFLFLVGTRGATLAEVCLRLKQTGVSLAEQPLLLSSLMVIPCRRGHREQLGESGMVPRYWSRVLDHLVAVSRVSRISQVKG